MKNEVVDTMILIQYVTQEPTQTETFHRILSTIYKYEENPKKIH